MIRPGLTDWAPPLHPVLPTVDRSESDVPLVVRALAAALTALLCVLAVASFVLGCAL